MAAAAKLAAVLWKMRYVGPESGLDRMDSTLFVLAILSRIKDRPLARLRASLTRYGRRRFAPSLTRSSTRTTSIQAIKAASRSAGDRSSLKILEAVSRVAICRAIELCEWDPKVD